MIRLCVLHPASGRDGELLHGRSGGKPVQQPQQLIVGDKPGGSRNRNLDVIGNNDDQREAPGPWRKACAIGWDGLAVIAQSCIDEILVLPSLRIPRVDYELRKHERTDAGVGCIVGILHGQIQPVVLMPAVSDGTVRHVLDQLVHICQVPVFGYPAAAEGHPRQLKR